MLLDGFELLLQEVYLISCLIAQQSQCTDGFDDILFDCLLEIVQLAMSVVRYLRLCGLIRSACTRS